MALRVLLADESTTIKKVMQLALQDFAVEVKAVHAGVDVVEVARSFKPDIIFIDVLLQKKNGYEVGGDLKKDSELKAIPIVLMWSSFMDLDEKLAQGSGAERRLEKPFDAQQLRQLVLDLVPRTRTQRLAHFLDFPKMPVDPNAPIAVPKKTPTAAPTPPTVAPVSASIPEPIPAPVPTPTPPPAKTPPPAPTPPRAASAPPPLPPRTPTAKAAPPPVPEKKPLPEETPEQQPPTANWNMDSFEDIGVFTLDENADDSEHEQFSELRIAPQAEPPKPEDDEAWSHQDLSRFQIVLPATSVEADDVRMNIQSPDHDLAAEVEPTLTGVQGLSFADYAVHGSPIEEVEPEPDSDSEVDQPAHNFGEELSLVETTEDLKFRQELREQRMRERERTQIPSPSPLTEFDRDPIPQMDVDRLEEILRAQSREIIESFVRRVLPDLASDIIRAELQRLLEEGPQ